MNLASFDSVVARLGEVERCDLCAEEVPAEHRHVLEKQSRAIMCSCRACSLLFEHGGAGGNHYRLIPERCTPVSDFQLDDLEWHALGIPVAMAYFVRNSENGRVTAFYPSPLGAVEAELELETWSSVEQRNPALRDLAGDVEALLVNKNGSSREAWIVGIDTCYRLVATMRVHWRGWQGGDGVWTAIAEFFDELRGR